MTLLFCLILILIGLASLSIEIVDSTLSNKIKKFFCLTPNNTIVDVLSSFKVYRGITGKWFIVLLPLWLPVILFFNFHKLLIELLDCPFCVSFHLGWTFFYFYLNTDVFISILAGSLAVLITKIIDKYVTL